MSFEEQQTHIREHVIRELLTIFRIFHQAAPLKVPKNGRAIRQGGRSRIQTSNTILQFVNAQQTVEPSKASIKNFNKMNKALMKKLGYSCMYSNRKYRMLDPAYFWKVQLWLERLFVMYLGIVTKGIRG